MALVFIAGHFEINAFKVFVLMEAKQGIATSAFWQ
jgi:hypothetical protein